MRYILFLIFYFLLSTCSYAKYTNTGDLIVTGNLGINSTSPQQRLIVNGNVYATGNITCGGTCGGTSSVDLSAVDQNIYPSVDNIYDIGSVSKKWKDIHVDGDIYGGHFFGDGSNLVGIGTSVMIYPGTGIAVSTGSAWGSSFTDNHSNWDTAYSDRMKWDGGNTGLNVSTARTSLGLNIGSDVQAYNSNLTAINQALTTTSSPSFTTVTAALNGNSSTTTKFSVARTINNHAFDGTANITITQGDIDLSLYATTAAYVPKTTTVNSKALSGNIVLSQSDIDLSLYAPLANAHFTGNIGIGSSSPRGTLDVDGVLYADTAYIGGTMTLEDGGSYVCFDRTTHEFYVKSFCP